MTKEQEQEYLALLDLLSRVRKKAKDLITPDRDRLRDAEGLGMKFHFHSTSIFYLSYGTIIKDTPSGEINFVDSASISTIARAALEAFLTFHYVFAAPKINLLRDLRYWAWSLSGLCARQKFLATKPEHQKKKAIEGEKIKQLHERLASNPEFIYLPKEQKNNIKNGRWRLRSWEKMARDAGLNEWHASTMYAYLCGYTHADSLSVLQIHDAMSREQQEKLSQDSVKNTMIAIANMIFLYCDVFPEGENVLVKNPEATQTAKKWRNIGQGK